MAADHKSGDDSSSEPSVRWSPRFARQQRRTSLFAGILGIVMGALLLIDAVGAIRAGTSIRFGSVSRYVELPGWLAALAGLFIVFIGGSILWRNVVRRS